MCVCVCIFNFIFFLGNLSDFMDVNIKDKKLNNRKKFVLIFKVVI